MKAAKIIQYPIYLFALLIPIWIKGASVFAVISLGIGLFDLIKNKPALRVNLFTFCCIGFFLLFLLSFCLHLNYIHWFEVEKRISFLILPTILMTYCKENSKKKNIIYCFIIGVIALNIYSIFNIITHFIQTNSLDILDGKIDDILHFQRPYLGLFNSLSIGVILATHLVNKKLKYLSYFILMMNVSIIILIGARFALIITTILIIVFLILSLIKNGKLNTKYIYGAITMILLFTLFGFNQIKRFKDITTNEPRIFIWNSAGSIIKGFQPHQYVIGFFSEPTSQKKLNNEYKKETELALESTKKHDEAIELLKKNNLLETVSMPIKQVDHPHEYGKWFWVYADLYNFNSHNQYLSVFMSYGIIGLIILIGILIVLLKLYIKSKSRYLLVGIIIFGGIMFVENILAKQHGVFSFLLLCSLFSMPSPHQQKH